MSNTTLNVNIKRE